MFCFSERHIEEFDTLGYTVFRQIVPAKLIDALRCECEKGALAARSGAGGPNAQRFQPVSAFPVEPAPFAEYQNLPEIRDAVSRVLGFDSEPSDILGVLLEPTDLPWCTHWHRDFRDNIQALELGEWERVSTDRRLFNQVNCALYRDSSTWIVPGSHLRRDTDAEIARFPDRPIHGPGLEGLSSAQRELACRDYCESMPGTQQLFLDAGDYCLYRSTLWHIGNYVPYCKRATLHDGIMTPEFKQWADAAQATARKRAAQGVTWENPNPERLAA